MPKLTGTEYISFWRNRMAKGPEEAGYVGMIGSRRKVRTTYDRLLVDGVPHSLLERVHAPIGLDIGAQTPAEIAVSILAEIIWLRKGTSGRPPTSLRLDT